MNRGELKKEITTNELAAMMMDGFERAKRSLEDLEYRMNSRFVELLGGFEYKINNRFNKLDRDYDGRLDMVEHQLITIKHVIEKDLNTPVRW